MPIDLKKENLITLREALAHFPSHREDKPPHLSRLYRYTKQGVLDQRLLRTAIFRNPTAVFRLSAQRTR